MISIKDINNIVRLKEFNLTIFYLYEENDTCPIEYVKDVCVNIKSNIIKHIPDFFDLYEIEIWNHGRKDCKFKGFVVDQKKKKILISTDILSSALNDELVDWNYLLAKAFANVYLNCINNAKNKYIMKKWQDLRAGHNTLDPINTIIDDFMQLFCYKFNVSKSSKTSIKPEQILGLKSLYIIWPFLLKVFAKRWNIIIYKKFVSMPKMNFLGFIYIEYDLKTKALNWNKITTQGFWIYSEYTDQWELINKF